MIRLFSLYLRLKKRYNLSVPICPRCNTTIHAGAESQCPACGYSLLRANAIFGDRDVEFTRVLDEAGALTHQDRLDLLRALEDMERNIPPIALCIYITDDGRAQDLRSHAHWVLNHARIHHPSFGRREKSQAIEDAALTERAPGERPEGEAPPVARVSWWQRLRARVRDILHPYPPPVRPEWMLILVLDVQLEMACFAWGYMLDPYINPDSINSCIIGARLQFRERAMAVGLKRVMKSAVSRIAAQSHGVNRRLRRGALTLGAALAFVAAPLVAQSPGPWADDEAAEEVEDTPAAPAVPTPAAQVAPSAGGPATRNTAPRWNETDYHRLLSGELSGGYKMLQAPGGGRAASSTASERTPRNRTQESDTKIAKHYYPEYSVVGSSSVIDPQKLLSGVELADVEHTLNELNAHAPYHLYIALYKQGQELPMELSVGSLVRSVAKPGEYAAMLLYGLGDSPTLELGYHEIKLSDDDRHAWLERVQRVAGHFGGVEGLMAAAEELHACLLPVAAELPPLTRQTAVHVPLIPLEMREDTVPPEPSLKDEMRLMLSNPALQPVLYTIGGILGLVGLVALLIWLRRRSGRLTKTTPDYRLASPVGAGVSRAVRYLEGKEAVRSGNAI